MKHKAGSILSSKSHMDKRNQPFISGPMGGGLTFISPFTYIQEPFHKNINIISNEINVALNKMFNFQLRNGLSLLLSSNFKMYILKVKKKKHNKKKHTK